MTNDVTATDVAKLILERTEGALTTMKLQKLVYYSQAWHLAWFGKPLFADPIEAWANGPVVYNLFDRHRGRYSIRAVDLPLGDSSKLTPRQRKTVRKVMNTYGQLTATKLSMLTHTEQPWIRARGKASDGARSHSVIEHDVMKRYYRRLSESDETVTPGNVVFPTWA